MKNFGLEPGMAVADFGCGSGHYTIAAARIVSPPAGGGTVYAIDVQKELLQAVKSHAEINNLKNIEIVWADLEVTEGSHLASNSLDFVIISNILFQAENRGQIAKEAFRVLKSGGKTAVIEWAVGDEPRSPRSEAGCQGREREPGKVGPVLEKRISKEEVQQIFLQEGFKMGREFQPGENHYGLIFMKP